jgi:DNA-binding beta-propeller fold protein YncE
VVFIAYIVFDTSRPAKIEKKEIARLVYDSIPEKWQISGELHISEGALKAVSVSPSGNIYAGGDSFVSCYTSDFHQVWSLKTQYPVTALSNWGDTIYASTVEMILVIGSNGKLEDEWGPFEDKSFITSVTSNLARVAYADAGNKMVVILDKQGRVVKIIGQNDGQFILPSPYFDVALDSTNKLYVANTGQRRIETRSPEGKLTDEFGEPGMAAGAFCGCCNPAHFIVTRDGFVTAEKGINRIKILGEKGEFIEFVSSGNKFVPSIPLDLASADGKTLYAADPADSKLYAFSRKSNK